MKLLCYNQMNNMNARRITRVHTAGNGTLDFDAFKTWLHEALGNEQ